MLSTQRAAQASLEWFENLAQYVDQEPLQFGFNIMTRSRRVTYDNLRVRDPEFVARCDEWFAGGRSSLSRPRRCSSPSASADSTLPNRIVVSPMDMYVAEDGLVGDFHLVHLGGKALGGAGLVMTEMVCVSPTGRITPGLRGHLGRRAAGRLGAGRRLRARLAHRRRSASSSGTPAPRAPRS